MSVSAILLCFSPSVLKGVLGASADFISNEIASAAGNLSTLNHDIAPSWISSSEIRSTSDILWSCIITLTACVYTAVHLNVPPIHESNWQEIYRKAGWVAMALFAPEIVLFTAYAQYSEAHDLVKELNNIRFGEENAPPTMLARLKYFPKLVKKIWHGMAKKVVTLQTEDTEKGSTHTRALDHNERYELIHGFFIVMGGCITRDVGQLSDKYSYATITPKGAILLSREGLRIDIPAEIIKNKGKINLIGKSLVCFQVIWFVAQCIARAAAGYPLVLIEIHTMVHVACALAMYIIWWKVGNMSGIQSSAELMRTYQKPQDVSDPLNIDTSRHMETLALHLMGSQLTCSEYREMAYAIRPFEATQRLTPEQKLLLFPHSEDLDIDIDVKAVDIYQYTPGVESEVFQHCAVVCGSTLLCVELSHDFESCVQGLWDPRLNSHYAKYPRDLLRWTHYVAKSKDFLFSPKDLRRWNYALKALKRRPEFSEENLNDIYIRTKGFHRVRIASVSESIRSENLISLNAEELSTCWSTIGDAVVEVAPNFPRRYLGPQLLNGILAAIVYSPIFYGEEHGIVGLSKKKAVLALLLTQLPTVYGAIHLVAWNFEFATNMEGVFWKITALTILGGFNASVVLAGCRYYFFRLLSCPCLATEAEEAKGYAEELRRFGLLCHFIDGISLATAFPCVIIYALSRIYLVVESFVSLRHVPIGAYAAVPWIEDIPHI